RDGGTGSSPGVRPTRRPMETSAGLLPGAISAPPAQPVGRARRRLPVQVARARQVVRVVHAERDDRGLDRPRNLWSPCLAIAPEHLGLLLAPSATSTGLDVRRPVLLSLFREDQRVGGRFALS